MVEAKGAPFDPRARRGDPHLDHNWNENPRPFVWHKTADEILESLAAY